MSGQTSVDTYSKRTTTEKADPWTALLKTSKKIKDAVHRSILLTEVEVSILDTTAFQRLRHIKQTGPAYLLYPTALHTRFDHSLGTLHSANTMAEAINRSSTYPQLTSRDILAIRIVALLHDLVHLPFGHSLEDAGRLFSSKQWQSTVRQRLFFKPVADVIKEKIVRAFRESGMTQEANREADHLLEQIQQTLVAEEDGKVEALESPYIADIVGNTVCADLLDYVKRDLFFCGLSGGFDELIFFYMTLNFVRGKKRLVIRLFKPGKKPAEIRPDVLTALVDLLRLRYSIGERVYYHHTKREASAMLIKMVAACMIAGTLDEEKLCEHSDDSLLFYVRKLEAGAGSTTREAEIAKRLEGCFSKRELYKPVYHVSIVDHPHDTKINELIQDWRKRYDHEETLCQLLDLKPGSVLIYVPSESMGSKQANALVQTPFPIDGSTEICTLIDLSKKKSHDRN